MHQDWKTQNIVVTGAASGLGRALCARFAHLDASVRGIDVNKAQLQELKAALGENFIPVICDVANWEEVVQVLPHFQSGSATDGETRIRSIAPHRLDRGQRGQRWDDRLFCVEGCRHRND